MSFARWNEHKLKEMRDEEDTACFQQRTSRLAKWRELVAEAAKEKSVKVSLPDALEHLVCQGFAGGLGNG